MAFTFQTNRELKLDHNEYLLHKAEMYRPALIRKEERPEGTVQIVKDETKLDGWWIQDEKMKEMYGKGESFILDFGKHVVGRFQIDIDSAGSPMDAPLYLKLKFAEMPCEFKYDSSDYDGWLSSSWMMEEYIHLDELPCTLKLPRRYSFRYVEITVLDTSPKWKAVFSNALMIHESSVDESQCRQCDVQDETIQRIYETGVHTLSECMQEVFEDGPKRDRRLWLGDLRLQALANYSTFDDTKLVKRCLYLFAGMRCENRWISANVFTSVSNIPDDSFLYEYSLFFISVLHDYLNVHYEQELLDDLYLICKDQMDAALEMVDESGRFVPEEKHPVFVDWSQNFDKTTAGQAMTIYVLKQFLTLMKYKKDPDIQKYRKKLERMEKYARENLFDAEKYLFVTDHDEYNIASQVWMILAHVMNDDENRKIMQSMMQKLFPVHDIATPYMYHHIVEAMFVSGLKEEAVILMKSYWGKMIDLGADTYWEAFDPNDPNASPYGSAMVNSYCHAWSCTPVYLIAKYLK